MEPLTEPQQLVVEIVSAWATGLDESSIQHAVQFVAPQPFEVRPHLKTLQSLGMLQQEGYTGYRPAPHLVETVLRGAARAGRLDKIALALAGRLQQSWGHAAEPQLRVAAYRGDWVEVDRLARKYPVNLPGQMARFYGAPFDAAWLETIPQPLRQEVLVGILWDSVVGFRPQPEAIAYAERAHGGNPAVLFFLAQAMVWCGRLSDCERLVDDLRYLWAAAQKGTLAFLAGDDTAAERHFNYALEVHRQQSGRRRSIFTDSNLLFYLLCLLRQRKYAEVRTLARAVPSDASYATAAALLRDAAERELGARPEQWPEDWMVRGKERPSWFVQLLHTWWTDADAFGPGQRPWLDAFEAEADRCGFTFWVEEARALRDRAAGRPGTGHLVDCLRRSEPWERVLMGLEALAGGVRPADKETRLAWFLNVYGEGRYDLTAREQKPDRSGWNKGKPLGLKTLHDKAATLPFLTPQDRQICGAIVREGPSYRFDWTRVLPALAGHPLVFDMDGTLLEMVSSPPELSIVRQPQGGLRVRLNPPYNGSPVRLQQDTPTRYRVVVFSPEHVKLGELIRQGVDVPAHASERLAQLGTAVSGLLTVNSDLGLGVGATEVPWDRTLRAVLVPWGLGLKVQFAVLPLGPEGPTLRPGQGGDVVVAQVGGRRVQTRRDRHDERERLDAFVNSSSVLSPGEAEWMVEELEACLDLLAELRQASDIEVQWPQGQKFKLAGQASSHTMSVSIAHSRDWFTLNGGVRVDEHRVVGMAELLKQARAGRYVRLSDTEFVALTDEFRRRLLNLASHAEEHRGHWRVHPLAAQSIEALLAGLGNVSSDEAWKTHLGRLEAVAAHVPQLPGTFQAELRPYQMEGFQWLSRLAAWGVGACLADDMGLGKTIQALAVIVARAPQGPTLVVAPASVGMNWVAEARRFAPTLNVRVYAEEDRDRPLAVDAYDLVVCTYGLLFQDRARLAAVTWTTVVLDEAQAIKNQGTRRSQAAKALQGHFRLVTTGTPVENHLVELWNLFDFLNPGLLGSMESFHRRFATPITRSQDPQARQALRDIIAPFILRRTKSQVLTELPPRTEVVLHVDLDERERSLYEALRKDALTRLHMRKRERQEKDLKFEILAELTKLRRTCCHPRLVLPSAALESSKLAALGEVLDELLDNRHKALVFSQFVDHLSIVREYLDGRGIRYQYLDGSTPIPARKKAVDAFQAGDGELFLISLRAGGTGLNLTAADYVIHLDPWWNPAVEDQASDRAHRIGQTRPVTVYRLVSRGTIEEQILALHADKRDLADQLLEGTETGAQLTTDQLLQLMVGPSPDVGLSGAAL